MQEQIKMAQTAIATKDLAQWTNFYSGYVREAALRRCMELGRSDLLALAVDRLNDWVPAIRAQARATVLSLLPNAQPDAIIATLEPIDMLRRARRENHGPWIAHYDKLVVEHLPVSILIEAMLMWRTRTSPICFRLVKEHALMEMPVLIKLALSQKAQLELAREGVELIGQLPESEREDYYRLALHSHFGAARSSAIRALLWRSGSANPLEVALDNLANPQTSIRAAVAHFLVQHGVDVRSRYRALILERPDTLLKMNLLSLAACGHAEDLELIKRHTLSALPSIRIAALLGWLKLEPQAKDVIASAAVRDLSPRVRRLGLTLVRRHGAFIPLAELHTAFRDTGDYKMLYGTQIAGVWAWLEAMTPLIMTDNVPEAERAKFAAELAQHFYSNTGHYQAPNASQIALLNEPSFMRGLRTQLLQHEGLLNNVIEQLETLNAVAIAKQK